MYYGHMELSLLSLAWKLGLHSSTLAGLSTVLLVGSKSKYLIDHYTTRRTITGNGRS